MSRLEWHPQQHRYELCGVIGADEYHEQVSNNAFTNRMAQWHLEKAVAVFGWLQRKFPDRAVALAQQLQLTPEQLGHWQTAIAQLYREYAENPVLSSQG